MGKKGEGSEVDRGGKRRKLRGEGAIIHSIS